MNNFDTLREALDHASDQKDGDVLSARHIITDYLAYKFMAAIIAHPEAKQILLDLFIACTQTVLFKRR